MTTAPEQPPVEMKTPLEEAHRAAGVPLSTWFGVLLPARFDDPGKEQRIARESAALLDTNFRAVLSMRGPDRVRYLNAVLTSNVRDLTEGQGTIGLLLNPQGHMLAEMETLALKDQLLILGHKFNGEKTAATLDKFIIMDDATLSDETAETGTLAIEGPEAPALVRELTGVELATLGERGHAAAVLKTASGEIPCRVLRRSLYGLPGAEFLVAHTALPAMWKALEIAVRTQGGAPIGYEALNALRLEAGVPWFGTDFGEQQIPHEAGLESTHISFTKGCYTGQEIVERVRSRGHVNRRLSGLKFSGTHVPATGAALTSAGADAGTVTSAAFSPLLGTAIGMGYLRREYNQPEKALQCGEESAETLELPLAKAISAAML